MPLPATWCAAPDGVVGYIDFETTPRPCCPLPLCHGRDALCYAHSTAIYLRQCGALEDARPGLWAQWLGPWPALQEVMEQTMHRMRFAATCPKAASWGVMCNGCGRRTICCALTCAHGQRTLWAPAISGRNIGSKAKGNRPDSVRAPV